MKINGVQHNTDFHDMVKTFDEKISISGANYPFK